jgi:hypothetical protein
VSDELFEAAARLRADKRQKEARQREVAEAAEQAARREKERQTGRVGEMIETFLRLMREHGNPGLRRYRTRSKPSFPGSSIYHESVEPSHLLGWMAWDLGSAVYLQADGRFRMLHHVRRGWPQSSMVPEYERFDVPGFIAEASASILSSLPEQLAHILADNGISP